MPLRSLASKYPSRFAARVRTRIVHGHSLRLHMALILSTTTLSGLLSSKLLLLAGLTDVIVRYPLAVVASYLVFLGLTRLWLAFMFTGLAVSSRHSSSSVLDGFDLHASGSSGPGSFHFGGGDSGGGGASDAWGVAEASGTPSGSSNFSIPGFDADFDDFGCVLIALAGLVLAVCGAGIYLIWAAPHILSDVAFNAVLAAALARRAKQVQAAGWASGVLHCTWFPFAVVLAVTVGLAMTVQRACPSAARLMDVFACPGVRP